MVKFFSKISICLLGWLWLFPDATKATVDAGTISIANCTCDFIAQPLDHFARGSIKTNPSTYLQRYCVYNKFDGQDWNENDRPIFFYAGNESPLEIYINNTGLMWQLGEKMGATLVFAEHRYEGKSKPFYPEEDDAEVNNCMAYSSSAQALEDYAHLIGKLFHTKDKRLLRPVIAFGGSYGGMLAGWMRIKYPTTIAGSIAASAPIWAFPQTNPPLDGAFIPMVRGVNMTTNHIDDPQKDAQAHQIRRLKSQYLEANELRDGVGMDKHENNCFINLLAVWPVMIEFVKSNNELAMRHLSKTFHLCDDLSPATALHSFLEWLKAPWFLISEGNYPFASNYITLAFFGVEAKMPPWPMQVACRAGGLSKDLGVTIEGNPSEVKFDIIMKPSQQSNHVATSKGSLKEEIRIRVDWNNSQVVSPVEGDLFAKMKDNAVFERLFVGLKSAIDVFYNVTRKEKCYNLSDSGASDSLLKHRTMPRQTNKSYIGDNTSSSSHRILSNSKSRGAQCNERIKRGSWEAICCNEGLNLPIYVTNGMGNDFFWPPTHPKGTTIEDVVNKELSTLDQTCLDPDSLFGYPQSTDPWSSFLDDYYGGLRLGAVSNIVFSNGLLDPWSAGGVYATRPTSHDKISSVQVQNITLDGSVVALVIPHGAHHLDLMFSYEDDPHDVTEAREIEELHIRRWIDQWIKQRILIN